MSKQWRVLSLGGGVQSTTLLLMSLAGVLEPLDAAIFADTQWEPKPVYDHIANLTLLAAQHGLRIERVTAGNLRQHVLQMVNTGREFPGVPLHMVGPGGAKSVLKRQCTSKFKVAPIHREIRRMAGMTHRPWVGPACEQWLGISIDEVQRMRDSRDTWIRLRYPLVEWRMTRADCVHWLTSHGYSTPPKSACVGCPYHGNREWQLIKQSAEDWADAVAFDHAIRTVPRLSGSAYLHASGKALDEADLSTAAERGQQSLFDQECEGVCEL